MEPTDLPSISTLAFETLCTTAFIGSKYKVVTYCRLVTACHPRKC